MQAIQMSDVLKQFALLLEEGGCFTPATELRGLADTLSFGGTETVAKIVTKVQKNWKSSKRLAIYPSTLKALLERISLILSGSGASKPAKDCATLLKLFVGDLGEDSRSFVSDLLAAIQAPVPAPKQKRKPLDAADVRAIADRLTTASSDNVQFDAAVAALEADTQIKTAELVSIANEFLGSQRSFKKKEDVFKAIRNRQIQDAIQASRERRGQKIAV